MTGIDSGTKTKAALVLVVLGGLFGAAFLFMKVLVEEIAPIEIAAGRLSLAAILVLAIVAARGKALSTNPAKVAKVSLLALMDSVVPFTLIAWPRPG